MNRIRITKDITNFACDYEKTFRGLGLDVPAQLKNLKSELARYGGLGAELKTYTDYIDRIIADYDNTNPTKNLLVASPTTIEKYIGVYHGLITEAQLKKEVCYGIYLSGKQKGKPRKKKFYELIVDRMHYDCVREVLIPFIEKMGIKTCVYCNVQYAITIDHKRGLYELDHRYPKSKYPFLCTSFYNLQPSCPTCNRNKNDDSSDFGLYAEEGDDLYPLHLLTYNSGYLKPPFRQSKINIHLVAEDNTDTDAVALAKSHNEQFSIDKTYEMLKDVAEETIWRCQAYDVTYINMFKRNFGRLYSEESMMRFLYGVYPGQENVHRRPLSKLIQDIIKDMSKNKK